jgi:hypothetical protein
MYFKVDETEEEVYVDRTEAPFLPPIRLVDESEDQYTAEAQLVDANITIQLPKTLLQKTKLGTFKVRLSKAASIMA